MAYYDLEREEFYNNYKCPIKAVEAEYYSEGEWEIVEDQLPCEFIIHESCRWDEERAMRIKQKLESVLCDPEGQVCIEGSKGDKKVIQDALAELEELEAPGGFAVELIDTENGKHKGEYVGIAPNFSRLDMVTDKTLAITFGSREQAEYFQKYCKKSSGGLDCVISKI